MGNFDSDEAEMLKTKVGEKNGGCCAITGLSVRKAECGL